MKPEELFGAVVSVLTGGFSVLLIYIGAKRLGLTDLQKAVSSETQRLIVAMKERIALLESKGQECATENAHLHQLVEELQERIDRLEKVLADMMVKPQAKPRARRAAQTE